MTRDDVKPIANPGYFTAFVMYDRIDVLIRSADWYLVPPIQRYLYNMAAREIRMEDAKTETRVYTFDRYEHMRQLIIRSDGQEWETAWEAWTLWNARDLSFGVVHLERDGNTRGDIILGDDPNHLDEFAPDDHKAFVQFGLDIPSHGVEGSDA